MAGFDYLSSSTGILDFPIDLNTQRDLECTVTKKLPCHINYCQIRKSE